MDPVMTAGDLPARKVFSMIERTKTEFALEVSGQISPCDAVMESQFDGTMVIIEENNVKLPQSGSNDGDRTYLGWSVYLSIAYFLVFTGYNAAQGVLTVLLPDLGITVLSIIYFLFGTAGLLAPLFVSRVGPKWTICIGLLTDVLWIGALLLNVAGVVIAASVLVGCGSGLIWVAEGVYVSRTRAGPRAHNVFWMIFFFNWVTAGVIGGILLTLLSPTIFLGVMLGICGVGFIMSIFAKSLPPLAQEQQSQVSLKGLLRSFLLFRQPKLLLMIPTVLTRATALGFFIAKLPVLLPSLSVVPFVMVAFAISLLVFQALLLLTWSRLPIWLFSTAHSALIVSALIICIATQYLLQPPSSPGRLYAMYVVSALLGAGEAVGMGLLNGFVSTLFPDDPTAVFSVVRGLEAYFIGSIVLICGFTPLYVPVAVICTFAVAALICVPVLLIKFLRTTTSGKDGETTELRIPNPIFRQTQFKLEYVGAQSKSKVQLWRTNNPTTENK